MSDLNKIPTITPNGNLDLYILVLKFLRHTHVFILSILLSLSICYLYYSSNPQAYQYEIQIMENNEFNLVFDKSSLSLLEDYDLASKQMFFVFQKLLKKEIIYKDAVESFIDKNANLDVSFKESLRNISLNKAIDIINTTYENDPERINFYYSFDGGMYKEYTEFVNYYLEIVEFNTFNYFNNVIDNIILGNLRHIDNLKSNNIEFLKLEILEQKQIQRYEIDYFNYEKKQLLNDLAVNLKIAKTLGISDPEVSIEAADFISNFYRLSPIKKKKSQTHMPGFMVGEKTLKILSDDLKNIDKPPSLEYRKASAAITKFERGDVIIKGLYSANIDLNNIEYLKDRFKEIYLKNKKFMVEYDPYSGKIKSLQTSKLTAYIISIAAGLILGSFFSLFLIEYKYRKTK